MTQSKIYDVDLTPEFQKYTTANLEADVLFNTLNNSLPLSRSSFFNFIEYLDELIKSNFHENVDELISKIEKIVQILKESSDSNYALYLEMLESIVQILTLYNNNEYKEISYAIFSLLNSLSRDRLPDDELIADLIVKIEDLTNTSKKELQSLILLVEKISNRLVKLKYPQTGVLEYLKSQSLRLKSLKELQNPEISMVDSNQLFLSLNSLFDNGKGKIEAFNALNKLEESDQNKVIQLVKESKDLLNLILEICFNNKGGFAFIKNILPTVLENLDLEGLTEKDTLLENLFYILTSVYKFKSPQSAEQTIQNKDLIDSVLSFLTRLSVYKYVDLASNKVVSEYLQQSASQTLIWLLDNSFKEIASKFLHFIKLKFPIIYINIFTSDNSLALMDKLDPQEVYDFFDFAINVDVYKGLDENARKFVINNYLSRTAKRKSKSFLNRLLATKESLNYLDNDNLKFLLGILVDLIPQEPYLAYFVKLESLLGEIDSKETFDILSIKNQSDLSNLRVSVQLRKGDLLNLKYGQFLIYFAELDNNKLLSLIEKLKNYVNNDAVKEMFDLLNYLVEKDSTQTLPKTQRIPRIQPQVLNTTKVGTDIELSSLFGDNFNKETLLEQIRGLEVDKQDVLNLLGIEDLKSAQNLKVLIYRNEAELSKLQYGQFLIFLYKLSHDQQIDFISKAKDYIELKGIYRLLEYIHPGVGGFYKRELSAKGKQKIINFIEAFNDEWIDLQKVINDFITDESNIKEMVIAFSDSKIKEDFYKNITNYYNEFASSENKTLILDFIMILLTNKNLGKVISDNLITFFFSEKFYTEDHYNLPYSQPTAEIDAKYIKPLARLALEHLCKREVFLNELMKVVQDFIANNQFDGSRNFFIQNLINLLSKFKNEPTVLTFSNKLQTIINTGLAVPSIAETAADKQKRLAEAQEEFKTFISSIVERKKFQFADILATYNKLESLVGVVDMSKLDETTTNSIVVELYKFLFLSRNYPDLQERIFDLLKTIIEAVSLSDSIKDSIKQADRVIDNLRNFNANGKAREFPLQDSMVTSGNFSIVKELITDNLAR